MAAAKDAVYTSPLYSDKYQLTNVCSSGQWLSSEFQMNLKTMPVFDVRNDDVYIVGFPKSGITWVIEMAYLIMNNIDTEKAQSNIQAIRVPLLEYPFPGIEKIGEYPDPRVIKTHVCCQLIPQQILQKKGKMIYVIRNPRDVSVSFYHFYQFMTGLSFTGTFEQFMDDFIKGTVVYGPWTDHVAAFWKVRHMENIHFVFYEELIKDPIKEIKRMADFLEKQYSDEEIARIADYCSFNNLKGNTSANFVQMEDQGLMKKASDDRKGLMRKGVIGDWVNHYNTELADRVDEMCKQTLQPLGLQFCYETNEWTKT